MKTKLFLTFFSLTYNFAFGEVTNSELSKKLDLILIKVNGLEQRITKLESENIEVKRDITKVEKTATEAKTATQSIAIPENPIEKKSFFTNLRNQIRSEEAKASGPWTKKESWDRIRKNMTEFNARKILGDPDKIKNSLSPRIEHVYKYIGDLDADGIEEEGIININRGRVHSFISPF